MHEVLTLPQKQCKIASIGYEKAIWACGCKCKAEGNKQNINVRVGGKRTKGLERARNKTREKGIKQAKFENEIPLN